MREFVGRHGACPLTKKGQQAARVLSKTDEILKYVVSTACRPWVFRIALFKGFLHVPHIHPPLETLCGYK